MTNSIIHIELHKTPDAAFDHPIRKRLKEKAPDAVLFDFDNFSEESTRQYATDLIGQSRKAAVLLQVKATDVPYTGLVQFFNRLQQLKHPNLLLLQEGPLPAQLEKMLSLIGGRSNYRLVQNAEEAEKLLLEFLSHP